MIASMALEFDLPATQVATSPPEARGTGRDDVRLMVFSAPSGPLIHTRFGQLGEHLRPGDAFVINVSATMPYALDARTNDGMSLRVHLSGLGADGLWSVEVRTPRGIGSAPGPSLKPQTLHLERGGSIHLLAQDIRTPRLWRASLELPLELAAYLDGHGKPIRYGDGGEPWPLSAYQTVYATEPGSAEMPSAGRPLTREMLVELASRGVILVPLMLHSGVSSFETGEVPGLERFRVSASAAGVVNSLRAQGGRVIAVGTTALRALESAADEGGTLRAADEYTDLVIGEGRGVRAIDGLLTGWHEPGASHLSIIESVAGPKGARRMYKAALDAGYLWHEFGDSCLILR
ncbi:MAG: S-adenosylmethionine:tRNA ribosyltransferase-isomerase [Acidimicrobiia bacterium]